MKHFQYIFLIIAFMGSFSCKEKPTEKLEIIRTYTSREVHARSLIDRVDFVRLETTKDNLIGKVSKILFTDSLIVIVDKKANAVYLFDNNGHYLRKIGSFGSGPNEYDFICDVVLSFDKTKIQILGINRLLTYDLNGRFLKSENTNKIIHLIEYVDKNTFAAYNRSGYFTSKETTNRNLLEIVNINFDKVLFSGIKSKYQRNDLKLGYEFPLINANGKIYLLPEISDTIFQVSNKEIIPRYYIKTRKPKPNSNEIRNAARKRESVMVDNFNGGFYHIGNKVIIPLMSFAKPLVFYNTKSKKAFSYDGYKVKDTHPLLAFDYAIKAQYKSSLVTVATPSHLISIKDRLYKCYDKKMIDRLLKNMTGDDNPVLLFYHVNKIEPH